jgi:hypothetical protein
MRHFTKGRYHRMLRLPGKIAVMLIRIYQKMVSPLFPPSCRFTPTCSSYAITSIERYGAMRGGWMAIRRISRCHPWNPGGFDPVP